MPAIPMMVMGATDGAYLRVGGIPTYGVHEGQTFLYRLVKVLAGGV